MIHVSSDYPFPLSDYSRATISQALSYDEVFDRLGDDDFSGNVFGELSKAASVACLFGLDAFQRIGSRFEFPPNEPIVSAGDKVIVVHPRFNLHPYLKRRKFYKTSILNHFASKYQSEGNTDMLDAFRESVDLIVIHIIEMHTPTNKGYDNDRYPTTNG